MSDDDDVILAPRARRAIEHDLPESVATAAVEFIYGALRKSPHRVGKQLREPLAPFYSARRGAYRVIYEIHDQRLVIVVVSIAHRREAYRR
jgi:mRNA interferase RelE/StbE